MAGIDFMALANGMMLGDKLNKEDDTYWRKQQQEDVTAQYTARDQAYKEQTQGYALDDYRAAAQQKDTNRLVSQAMDTYSKAAQAQGKQPWQVIMESPNFDLPGASPEAQAQFGAAMRVAVQGGVVARLRETGQWQEADALETKLGMANRGGSVAETTRAYSDPVAGAAFVKSRLGIDPGADGMYDFNGTKVPLNQVIAFAGNPNSIGATLPNIQLQNKQNDALAAANAEALAARAKITQSSDNSLAINNSTYFHNAATSGMTVGQVPAHLQQGYAAYLAAGAPAAAAPSNPNSIDALTSQRSGPVTPGVSPTGGYRSAMPAAAMPAAAMPAAASAVKASGSPPIESWRPAVQVQGADPTGMSGVKSTPSQNAMASDINHKSSKELSDLRYAITTGQRIPGLNPAQLAVYLKDINDEIASRHKLEAVRYARSIKQ